MPKLTNRDPKYSLHKASGRAVVTIDGKDIYLGLWGSVASKKEYDRQIRQWKLNGRRLPGTCDICIAEMIERYIDFADEFYRKDGAPTSEGLVCKLPLAVLNRLYGDTPAQNFGPLAFDTVIDEMIAKRWCRKSINRHIGRIKRVFKWGARKELIPGSTFHALIAVEGLG